MTNLTSGPIKDQNQFLWVEAYRPNSVVDTILPSELKQVFQQFVDQQNIPNLILAGSSGLGKTTIARAMLEQLGCDYIVINGSLNGNIDTLRNDIQTFASSVSLMGGRKYVILDEADYLTPVTQAALRNFMEEYSANCGFILTCNYKNKILPALHSRCSVINISFAGDEATEMKAQFYKRACQILSDENIAFDKKVVANIMVKHFPDFRRTLNELQRYSATGKIDAGILANLQKSSIVDLVRFINDKNYTSMRTWVHNNIDTDITTLYQEFYDTANEYFTSDSIPVLVLLIAKYQFQAAFAASPEINFMAFITEVMVECEFK